MVNEMHFIFDVNFSMLQHTTSESQHFMSTLHILSYDTSKIALLIKTNTTIKHIYGCYCSLLISADRKML